MTLEAKEKEIKLNEKFKENNETIEKLQANLLQDIMALNFSKKEIELSREYIKDKVNIFRFLKQKRYDYKVAHVSLLDSIQWRIENQIDQLNYNSCIEFFKDGFAFFHGKDSSENHPLLFIRLGYYPRQFREPGKSMSQQLQPFTCYLLDIARKYTWDLTKQRIGERHPNPLVWKIKVIVNVAKAPLLPIDGQLITVLGPILSQNFPGFISSIHVLNFGWMYQGIWSILKLLLSDKAKSFIHFTSVNELAPIISKDRILKEMGGSNDFVWSIENDPVLQKYGRDLGQEPTLTRSRSSSVSDNDEFFDARDTFQPKEPVVPSTFNVVTQATPRNHPVMSQVQAIFRKFLYNLFQSTFGPQKGLVYWVVLYVFLRGPVEHLIQKALIHSALVKTKRLNSTTIGITAVVAAIVSTGITRTLEKYRK